MKKNNNSQSGITHPIKLKGVYEMLEKLDVPDIPP